MPWEEDLDLEIVCASHFFSKSPVKSYFKEYRYIKYVLWPMSSTVNKDTTYLETAHKSLQSIYMKTVNSQILLEVFSTTRFITPLQAYRQTKHKEIGNLTRGSGGGVLFYRWKLLVKLFIFASFRTIHYFAFNFVNRN